MSVPHTLYSFYFSFHDVRCPLLEAEDDEDARSQASQASYNSRHSLLGLDFCTFVQSPTGW